MAAAELVDAYRLHGHTAARLDPLASEPRGHPMLARRSTGSVRRTWTPFPCVAPGPGGGGRQHAVRPGLAAETYTSTIGYEYEHLEDPARREWLRRGSRTGITGVR
jgi:multifunctional 2-oxoglutarate metabolism enzyme